MHANAPVADLSPNDGNAAQEAAFGRTSRWLRRAFDEDDRIDSRRLAKWRRAARIEVWSELQVRSSTRATH